MRIKALILLSMLLTACGGFEPGPLQYESSLEKKNSQGEDPSGPVTFESEYAALTRLVFEPKCLRCHNSQTSKGGVNLSSLSFVQQKLSVFKAGRPSESSLYNTILEGSMPPSGEPISDELTERIRKWIESAP